MKKIVLLTFIGALFAAVPSYADSCGSADEHKHCDKAKACCAEMKEGECAEKCTKGEKSEKACAEDCAKACCAKGEETAVAAPACCPAGSKSKKSA